MITCSPTPTLILPSCLLHPRITFKSEEKERDKEKMIASSMEQEVKLISFQTRAHQSRCSTIRT